jgi:hypothetical protein
VANEYVIHNSISLRLILSESMPFDVLHCFFVFLGGGFGFERAEVPAFPVFGFFFREYKR